jgi:hypothetical protein
MFPEPTSRFRTALRRSLDAAIDFATLGEYGWAAAWEGPDAAGGGPSAPGAAGGTATAITPSPWTPAIRLDSGAGGAATAVAESPAAALLRPASAAGRARKNAEVREAACCAGQPLRSRARDPQLPRAARSRDGMAPREQGCTTDAAG